MRILYFTHSLTSCWNHGNAHFLRGLLRELAAFGHDVTACAPSNGWSQRNLIADHGEAPLLRARQRLPEIKTADYDSPEAACHAISGADLVIVHEWT